MDAPTLEGRTALYGRRILAGRQRLGAGGDRGGAADAEAAGERGDSTPWSQQMGFLTPFLAPVVKELEHRPKLARRPSILHRFDYWAPTIDTRRRRACPIQLSRSKIGLVRGTPVQSRTPEEAIPNQ